MSRSVAQSGTRRRRQRLGRLLRRYVWFVAAVGAAVATLALVPAH